MPNHSPMDLNAEIAKSLSLSPAESADRSINEVMGEHYQFVTSPHLNPTPDEQVAMQQVRPAPNYDAKVQPIVRRTPIPNRTWSNGSYVVSHQNGTFTLLTTTPRSFLGFKMADKEEVIYSTSGGNAVERMISYLDNSNLPSGVVSNLTDRLAASAGIRLAQALSEVKTTGTFTSAMFDYGDYVVQVSPTGVTNDVFDNSGYEWGNTISELPDF